jgi:hypothetical protein
VIPQRPRPTGPGRGRTTAPRHEPWGLTRRVYVALATMAALAAIASLLFGGMRAG